jgi:UDP-N-acetylmuramoyl-tripeptide--D-alanyl-D-alanine ligase
VRAEKLVVREDLTSDLMLRTPVGSVAVHVAARGRHNVDNALAAAAVGVALGVELEAVAHALASAEVSAWRMELRRTPGGATLLNDAYNANPVSMRAALESLASLPAGRRVAVLGPMAELGAGSGAEHRAVAELAGDLGIRVLAVATDAYGTERVEDVAGAARALGELGPDDAVLVKGSRVAGLEALAHRLLGE